MESPLFKIIFDGQIKEGYPAKQVKINLAGLFRTNTEKIDQLFANTPIVIKGGLSKQQAVQYQQAIEHTGVRCRVALDTPATKTTRSIRPKNAAVQSQPSSKAPLIICPKCGFKQEEGGQECVRCGIIFRKFTSQPGPDESVAEYDDETFEEEGFHPEVQQVEKEGWLSLGGGLLLAGIIFLFPFWTYVFHAFVTLVHELGHSVFAWIFGYPAIPAFDFMYGGGVALHFERRIILVIAVYGVFVFLFYTYRKNLLALIVLAILVGLYTLFAFTPLHEMLALFMGHGTELFFAGLFLYRALSGSSVIIAIERPLYAFLGFFTQFSAIRFAYKLLADRDFLYLYLEGKGGITNDFVRIAREYLHVDLSVVASLFLFCSLLPPIIAFLFFRYKAYIFLVLSRLLRTEQEE